MKFLFILTIFSLLLVSLVPVRSDSEPAIQQLDSCSDDINEVDKAKLFFYQNNFDTVYSVYAVNSQCYKCSKTLVASFSNSTDICVSIWTPFEWKLYLYSSTNPLDIPIDEISKTFGDQAEYRISVENNQLDITETKSPYQTYEPLIIFIALLVFIAVVSFAYEPIWNYYNKSRSNSSEEDSKVFNEIVYSQVNTLEQDSEIGENKARANITQNKSQPGKSKERFKSLDTFRGLSLTLMIFVNYGGGGYWFFDHAPWNGLTLADLVFPWFMWIMGVSMALSFSRILPDRTTLTEEEYNKKYYHVWYKVVVRSLKLFLIGMFLANGYEYQTWRIPGVLQYFGLSYFLVASTILICYSKTQDNIKDILEKEKHKVTLVNSDPNYETNLSQINFTWEYLMQSTRIRFYSRIMLAYSYEWIIQATYLLIYICIVFFVAAPGCPMGYNGPGGISDNSNHYFCTGGIHRYIDMKMFTYQLIFHHPTCLSLYSCRVYDPEGFLGIFTASVLTYLGLMSGRVLLHYKTHRDRLLIFSIAAFVLLLITGLLCGFSQNDGLIPVNKNLWSISFITVTSGFGLVGLSLCYIPIDVYHLWTGAPFIYLGMNSILIYVGHGILQNYMPFSYMVYDVNHGSLLQTNVLGVFSWVVIAYYFYKIKFFVKV